MHEAEDQGSTVKPLRTIGDDDIEELELLYRIVLANSQSPDNKGMSHLYAVAQRMRHILIRVRGDFEE